MRRVLLIGNSPLPDEDVQSRPAAGLRTYQFLKAIERSGCVVKKVLMAMPECYGIPGDFIMKEEKSDSITGDDLTSKPDGGCASEEQRERSERNGGDTMVRQAHHDNEAHHDNIRIPKDDPDLLQKLQKLCDEFVPEAIVAVNTFPSFMAAQLETRAPLWCDLNGWILAEAQAQAFKMTSNDYLAHYLDMEEVILRRADKISCVSLAQSEAVLGELGLLGRLNSESFGYEFTKHVPNGIEWFEGEEMPKQVRHGTAVPVQGENSRERMDDKMPDNAFMLLWIGGYNTWVDEVTLCKGVVEAMKKCERLYFVSTGGGIAGLDNQTFSRFKNLVEASEYRERFVFLGWVATSDIPHVYARASAGLNVDRRCAETLTGARNRINEMMKFGVPVITTFGSEISYEVVKAGAGLGVRSGRPDELAEAIIKMYHYHGGYGENGKKYVAEKCKYEVVCAPLLEWLKNPRPAPDRGVSVGSIGGGMARGALRYLREHGFKKTWKKILQRI